MADIAVDIYMTEMQEKNSRLMIADKIRQHCEAIARTHSSRIGLQGKTLRAVAE